MNAMTDEDFIKFIKSYKNGNYVDEKQVTHNFYDSLTELSKSDSPPYDSLIDDSYKMYGLDWIVKASDIWRDKSKQCLRNPKLCRHEFPKSVDALIVNKVNNKLISHFIEFKFFPDEDTTAKIDKLYAKIIEKDNKYRLNKSSGYEKPEKRCFDDEFIEDFKIIKNGYVDNIENSLQLKPYEAIFIVLPNLYEEYCNIYNEPLKDIKSYLANMEKNYWVCINSKTKNQVNLHSQAKRLEKYYKRMKPSIFKETHVKTSLEFKKNLKDDILI